MNPNTEHECPYPIGTLLTCFHPLLNRLPPDIYPLKYCTTTIHIHTYKGLYEVLSNSGKRLYCNGVTVLVVGHNGDFVHLVSDDCRSEEKDFYLHIDRVQKDFRFTNRE